MGLESRLKRLENVHKLQKQEYRLYDPVTGEYLTDTDAEVITVPTPTAEGLARLADGTEKAVVMKGKIEFDFDADRRADELWWICQDGLIFHFGNRITEEDI